MPEEQSNNISRREVLATAPGLVAAIAIAAGCNEVRVAQQRPSASRRAQRPPFEADRAWKHLLAQCDFGPRPPGTAAHRRTRNWLLEEMGKVAGRVVAQDFTYNGMTLTNVIGVFNPEAKRQVLLCAHWDTRPIADMEIDPVKAAKPILGANDGASGVAVLLELGRLLKLQPPAVSVVMVLFDGEDYGDFQQDKGVFLGSRHFARNQLGFKPKYGILLDMVGDKNLDIYRERYSEIYAPDINRKVFRIAAELGYSKYLINTLKHYVEDDHIPLNRVGIPTINLIDFDYGPWHTLDDVPANCSAESLRIVGETVAEVMYREPA